MAHGNADYERLREALVDKQAEIAKLKAELAALRENQLRDQLDQDQDARHKLEPAAAEAIMVANGICKHCGVFAADHGYEHLARECYPRQIDKLDAGKGE